MTICTFLKEILLTSIKKRLLKQVLNKKYIGKIYVSNKISTFSIRNLNMLYFTEFKTIFSILEYINSVNIMYINIKDYIYIYNSFIQ